MLKVPGPLGHYLHGHTAEFNADPLAFLLMQAAEYGDLFRFRLGLQQVFVVSDLAEIQKILSSPNAFADKENSPRVAQAYTQSLARIEGDTHLARRRLLAPAFTWENLAQLGTSFAITMREHLANWQDAESRDVAVDLKTIVLRNLVAALLGHEGAARAGEIASVLAVIEAWLGSQPMQESDFRVAEAQMRQVLLEIASERRAQPDGQQNVLNCLLAGIAQDSIEEAALVDEVAMMLLTTIPTATALHWLWYYLASQEDVYLAARAEVAQQVGADVVATEHFAKLRYLDHACAEALRLHPPVWTLSRVALADWQIGAYTIPKGGEVLLSPYLVHRAPQYWLEPERFAPERFIAGAPLFQERPRLALLPFGAGQRKCIGERLVRLLMLLCAASLLQEFRPSLPVDFEVQPHGKRAMRPGDGVHRHFQFMRIAG